MTHPRDDLAAMIDAMSDGPLFVHSDMLKTRCFIDKAKGRNELLTNHLGVLHEVAGQRDLWTPCFNYDFTKSGYVDLREAPCQVGPLGEFRRLLENVWRSPDPIFSTCGSGSVAVETSPSGKCYAFGDQSIFAELYRRDGSILFYGAPFSSITMIHFAESLAGSPIYRYDKSFSGEVIDASGQSSSVEYIYHVRPMGKHLDYDWPRLISEAEAEGILTELRQDSQVVARVVSASKLMDYWVKAMEEDPFYLLDEATKAWAVPEYERLGRRFLLSDFE
ncbi:hypothetical protein C5Y96_11665 [Blastopirellula marina]|uniref:Aminoglycoside N(3)-acetyltransferase n=1 Tax=Blastopirellula marina TaxID=124 RepID=A0A2S8FMR1_9BACT|nr:MULTISPECIES: AAC(3) family N-acetyltransferase [Pirellulaceae]PQO33489.1 hypothetical protein C5Y96_11665 [Blastopirellula marina]RCS52580.1 hypothetical protein DTL36_11675 [Bremerella cremea]